MYNVKVEWDDTHTNRVTHVNKKIWNPATNEFEPRIFIRVKCSSSELRNETAWMEQQFGPSMYQGKWWVTELTNDLWMSDSLATFWYLKHGKQQ